MKPYKINETIEEKSLSNIHNGLIQPIRYKMDEPKHPYLHFARYENGRVHLMDDNGKFYTMEASINRKFKIKETDFSELMRDFFDTIGDLLSDSGIILNDFSVDKLHAILRDKITGQQLGYLALDQFFGQALLSIGFCVVSDFRGSSFEIQLPFNKWDLKHALLVCSTIRNIININCK